MLDSVSPASMPPSEVRRVFVKIEREAVLGSDHYRAMVRTLRYMDMLPSTGIPWEDPFALPLDECVRLSDAFASRVGALLERAKEERAAMREQPWFRSGPGLSGGVPRRGDFLYCAAAIVEEGVLVKRDRALAFSIYVELAEVDPPEALSTTGWLHTSATSGAERDMTRGKDYFARSAATGNSAAMRMLAVLCTQSEAELGVPKEWGFRTLRDLADRPETANANVLFSLAVLYAGGVGVTRDRRKAVVLYSKAAEMGHDRARVNLGVMYDTGKGVAVDANKAVELYELAARGGIAQAATNLYIHYNAKRMYARAADWAMAALLQGQSEVRPRLARYYQLGLGVAADCAKSEQLGRSG